MGSLGHWPHYDKWLMVSLHIVNMQIYMLFINKNHKMNTIIQEKIY